MTGSERPRRRAVSALLGIALVASLVVVAVLLLGGVSRSGGAPSDLASEALLVGLAVAVASSVFAFAFAMLALRDRDAVDEVFLVHLSGLLLVHLSKSLKAEKDQDILVGMLTAVQSFILEAFAKGPTRELRQMDFGKHKILIGKGAHSYLAVLVRGRRPVGFAYRLRRSLGKVEYAYGRAIATWDGTPRALEGVDDLLRRELMDVRLRTLAKDVLDTAVDGVTLRIVSWLQRRHGPALERTDADARGPRARATDLLERPEACDTRESNHELIWSALEQIEEGRFTLAGATNVGLALALQRNPRPGVVGWWDEVLVIVRDVLRTWPWDPATQAWVEGPAPPAAPEAPEGRPADEAPMAPPILGTVSAPPRRSGPGTRRA